MEELVPYAVDWRALFSALSVPWIDRGANCSRDNINICCPYCGDDSGYHMRVSESYEIYNCWRDKRHGGTNFIFLLYELGNSRAEALALLNEYRTRRTPIAKPVTDTSKHAGEWQSFLSLANAPAGSAQISYLKARGFPDPYRLAARYDLRYAPAGAWAMRVLFPLTTGGEVCSWTGRRVKEHFEPRYRVGGAEDPAALYVPRIPRTVMYVVEGQMDALKIAAGFEGTGVSAVALGSKDLNAGRILHLQRLAPPLVHVLLDADAPMHQQFQMQKDLRAALRSCTVSRCRMPAPYKDAGQIPEDEIKKILMG